MNKRRSFISLMGAAVLMIPIAACTNPADNESSMNQDTEQIDAPQGQPIDSFNNGVDTFHNPDTTGIDTR